VCGFLKYFLEPNFRSGKVVRKRDYCMDEAWGANGDNTRLGPDQAVSLFIERLMFLLVLRYFLIFSTGLLFLWGATVLLLRVTMHVPVSWFFNILAGGILVTLIAAWAAARRHKPSLSQVRALLDGRNYCGGILMSDGEADLGQWRKRLALPGIPSVAWQGMRVTLLFSLSLLFSVAACMVPEPARMLNITGRMDISELVDELQSQVELLEQEKILDPEHVQELKAALAELQDGSSSAQPEKTWEALDHLQEMLSAEAKEATEKLLASSDALAAMEAGASLMEKVSATEAGMTNPALSSAMTELADLMSEFMKENPGMMNIDPDLLAACEGGALSAEQMAELAKNLRSGSLNLSQMAEMLSKARLVDARMLERLNAGQGDGDKALADFLALCEGGDMLGEDLGALLVELGLPGMGGVNRGRGDAPMTWTSPSTEEGVTFKPETLSPGSLSSLKDSQLLGTSLAKPEAPAGSASVAPGALESAAAGGGSANVHQLLPRHRSTVQNYFRREE
jgi:hypothetical protein